MNHRDLYCPCRLCPRACGADRRAGAQGFCRQTDRVRVAHVGPHHGEEPPISGTRGSGAVFFSGCTLQCAFCQNHQISRSGLGRTLTPGRLRRAVEGMIKRFGVHNVNFVTPDHFLPHVLELVEALRRSGLQIPVVFNLSGFQSVPSLRRAEAFADIYLPDYKYGDPSLAARFSNRADYPSVALDAIAEMLRQKGCMDDACSEHRPARRGVLVRHLILPGHVHNSLDALSLLFVEFGPRLPLSLMSQYHPVGSPPHPALNRFVRREEFDRVYAHALELGFEHLYVQFPESPASGPPAPSPLLPDFRRKDPFGPSASRKPVSTHAPRP